MRRVVGIFLLLSACSQAAPGVAATEVELKEGSITVEHRVLAAGQVSLEIENYGKYPHTLVVTTESGMVLAATGLVPPGESVVLPVVLGPGGYQFSCRIVATAPDGSLLDHYQLGMMADVVVREHD